MIKYKVDIDKEEVRFNAYGHVIAIPFKDLDRMYKEMIGELYFKEKDEK